MKWMTEHQSVRLYQYVEGSRVLRHVARFGAVYLIWIMFLFAIEYMENFFWFPAVLLPWGVTLLFSTWIKRPRPYQKYGFQPVITPSVQTTSFPSEHATIAFAFAAMFLPFGPLFYVILFCAMLVALARVAVGVHYFSDVLVGAVIGFALSLTMLLSIIFFQAF